MAVPAKTLSGTVTRRSRVNPHPGTVKSRTGDSRFLALLKVKRPEVDCHICWYKHVFFYVKTITEAELGFFAKVAGRCGGAADLVFAEKELHEGRVLFPVVQKGRGRLPVASRTA